MGVLIFTHDAEKYRVGDFVEGSTVLSPPSVEGLTIIVHKRKPTAKECLAWLPHIAYRMVWVCEQPPKIKDDSVIVDGHFAKNDYTRSIETTMRLRNRSVAFEHCATVPVPLMLAFLRENNNDIRLWRTLAKAFTHVPERFQQAMIAFAHSPVRRMKWPKKKKRTENSELPMGVRTTDVYWERIVRSDNEIANDLRTKDKKSLPEGMKKRVQIKDDGWL